MLQRRVLPVFHGSFAEAMCLCRASFLSSRLLLTLHCCRRLKYAPWAPVIFKRLKVLEVFSFVGFLAKMGTVPERATQPTVL